MINSITEGTSEPPIAMGTTDDDSSNAVDNIKIKLFKT
jgi:hypothetical protein